MITVLVEGPEAEGTAHLIGKAAFASGQYSVSFSLPADEYSRSFVKMDKNPFFSRDISEADFLLVTSDIDYNEILKKAKKNAILIANSKKKPVSRYIKSKKIKVKYFDATSIALETMKSLSLAAVMLGALVKLCDSLTIKGSKSVLEGNSLAAFDEAYKK